MIVSALTGFAPISALMISAVLIALHTLSGGQASIIKLDRIQCFIIIAGLLITALWLGHYNAPVIYEIKFELVNQQFPVERLVYFLLVLGGSYIVCPMLYGRVLSAKNEHVAQKGVLAAAIVMVLVSILIVLIGLLARGLIPADTPTDSVLTTVLGSVFPHWLTVLIYLVLLSAVVSSADSCLLTAGIVLSQDILRKDSITATRWHTAILMAIAFLLTFTNKSILDFLLMANDVYVAGVVAPVFICLLYAHTTKKANPHLALLGVFLGGSLGLISALSASNTFFYTGIASSIIFTLLSFQTKTTQPKGQ